MGRIMKTASLPSLRADPELRAAAESVLKEGEGLSSLIEDSVRRQIDYGKIQAEFIARGLAGLAEAERTGIHHTTADVMELMREKLEKGESPQSRATEMTFESKYTQTFYEDLGRPSDFLVERNPDLAERAISGIEKALMILQDFPLRPDALPRMVRCCARRAVRPSWICHSSQSDRRSDRHRARRRSPPRRRLPLITGRLPPRAD